MISTRVATHLPMPGIHAPGDLGGRELHPGPPREDLLHRRLLLTRRTQPQVLCTHIHTTKTHTHDGLVSGTPRVHVEQLQTSVTCEVEWQNCRLLYLWGG